MESMLSERGKKLLVIENYTFRNDRETTLGVSYRCTKKGCTSISVDKLEQIVLERRGQHNHPCVDNLLIKKLQNGVKRKATEDISQRPSKIINVSINKEASNVNITTKNVENIRKSIYRARRSVLPPLPRNIEDVHDAVDSCECKTNKGENFLLVNERKLNIILFSCYTNLKYLCSRSKIYVDGTFDYSPKFFLQLFTIHTIENGHYIPLVFALLPNKRSQTYFETFKLLENYCNSVNLLFRPTDVVCDFEKAIHVGIKNLWPEINIIGCRFHLTQSWYRKIQNLGLTNDYKKTDSEVGQWLRWTFGLLFLDPVDVESCFVEELYSDIPHNQQCIKYADYLVENYIADDAVFQPKIWASCSSGTERTTNACESFHSLFNTSFYIPHPDIYKFIQVMVDIQLNSYIKMNSVDLPITCKNIIYKKRQQYINNVISLYKCKTISRYDFIKSVCYQYVKK